MRKWLIVADAPLDLYGQPTIDQRLTDVNWVARAAIAHEAIVESCMGAPAVLPMKLLTIFTSDERARDQMRADSARIDAIIGRVVHHQEWGLRVVLDVARARSRSVLRRGARLRTPAVRDGRTYLARKRAQHDSARELERRARDAVSGLYERLAAESGLARRRSLTGPAKQPGTMLLDAAFLVPLARVRRFRSLVARQARAFASHGYRLTLTGPWPPYSFVERET